MTIDINFNITGIENLIEDLKKTRCDCDNAACNNNSAWAGRETLSLPPKCLLSHVCMDEEGGCGDNSHKKLCRDQYTVTGPAIEASVRGSGFIESCKQRCNGLFKGRGLLPNIGKPSW